MRIIPTMLEDRAGCAIVYEVASRVVGEANHLVGGVIVAVLGERAVCPQVSAVASVDRLPNTSSQSPTSKVSLMKLLLP